MLAQPAEGVRRFAPAVLDRLARFVRRALGAEHPIVTEVEKSGDERGRAPGPRQQVLGRRQLLHQARERAEAERTIELTRIMMPFLLLVSLAAAAMGMLNARGRFGAAAVGPALFNVGALAVGVSLWAAGLPPARAVVGWALGVLLGGALQLGVQLPALHALGYRFRPRLSRARLADPAVRRVFVRVAGPARAGPFSLPAIHGSRATASLDSGKALAKLNALVEFSQAFQTIQ